MTSLPDRLRDSARAARALDRSALLAEAADQIEFLENQIEKLMEQVVLFRTMAVGKVFRNQEGK